MVQKYQNEISPILYYGISTKINGKDLKIPNLQPPNWKSPYWMTLYNDLVIQYISYLNVFLDIFKAIVFGVRSLSVLPGYYHPFRICV